MSSSPDAFQRIASFFDIDPVSQSIEANDFDVGEEISMLIGLMRGDENPAVQIAAHKAFRNLLKEVATLNGLIAQATKTEIHNADNGRIESRVQAKTLLSRIHDSRRDVRLGGGHGFILHEARSPEELGGGGGVDPDQGSHPLRDSEDRGDPAPGDGDHRPGDVDEEP